MALRDQPYLPLYVQDFLADEKLIECSAASTGVYIRLMCIMHKSDEYGVILLKQRDKQSDKPIENFALKLAKHLPYSIEEIITSLTELINEGVLQNEGDRLYQKRMIRDNEISLIRADAGKKGGLKTQHFAKDFALAKSQATSEYENENENEDKSSKKVPTKKERSKTYAPLARQLSRIIKTKRNVKITGQQLLAWSNEIRRLVEENEVSIDRIRTALDWYEQHIDDPYTPVIQSGMALREKFLSLERAIEKEKQPRINGKSKPETKREYGEVYVLQKNGSYLAPSGKYLPDEN
jgi:hypothetical protein